VTQRPGAEVSDEHVERKGIQKYFCDMSKERPKDDNDEFRPRGDIEGRETDSQEAQDFVVNERCEHEERNAKDAN
jgi:hypothetical protein